MLALCACTAGAAPTSASSTHDPTLPGKSSTPTPVVTVEPVLVVASVDVDGKHLTASGYVQGVVEDGGTCTFVFTRQGSPDIKVDHEAVADRTTTSCGTVQPDATQFSRGSWQVTLGYVSNGKDYTSSPATVEVP